MLAESDPDCVVVDLGHPVKGFLLGVLLIVGTVGGYFLWDDYHGSADASATVVTAQSK